jgi:hypothetical protein
MLSTAADIARYRNRGHSTVPALFDRAAVDAVIADIEA